MPESFYPLMLIVILAGYIFLFVQGRMVRRAQEDTLTQLARLDAALRDLATRSAAVQAPAPAQMIEAPAGPTAAEIREELEPRLRQILQMLDTQGDALEAVRQGLAEVQQSVRASGARPAPADLAPEEIARRFLLEEGFSRIHITGSDVRDGGTRFLIRAMRGDEVRQGHVLVKAGKIADATLKAPSALFP
jgi:hypothetical protein